MPPVHNDLTADDMQAASVHKLDKTDFIKSFLQTQTHHVLAPPASDRLSPASSIALATPENLQKPKESIFRTPEIRPTRSRRQSSRSAPTTPFELGQPGIQLVCGLPQPRHDRHQKDKSKPHEEPARLDATDFSRRTSKPRKTKRGTGRAADSDSDGDRSARKFAPRPR